MADLDSLINKIKHIDKAEEEEILNILEKVPNNSESLKQDLQALVKTNRTTIELLEDLKKGKDPVEIYRRLSFIESKQEEYGQHLIGELDALESKGEIEKSLYQKIKKMENAEETIEKIESIVLENLEDKRPSLIVDEEQLDHFLELAADAEIPWSRQDPVKEGFETGGIFIFKGENNGDYVLGDFIPAPPDKKQKVSYDPPEDTEKRLKRIAIEVEEREKSSNLIIAHSHPPGHFKHSDDDIDYLVDLGFKDVSSLIGLLAVRKKNASRSPANFYVCAEILENGVNLPIRVHGADSETMREKYPLIHKYNQAVRKSIIENGEWTDYI